MKDYIQYMYNLFDVKIIKNSKEIIISDSTFKYYFTKVSNRERLYDIYNILNNRTEYDKIMKNRFGKIVSLYQNIEYVLIQKNNDCYIKSKEIVIPMHSVKDLSIVQSNWKNLWEKKIDFYESHITNNKLLLESKDYFIGITEMLIQYLKINNIETHYLYVCQSRIGNSNNPLSIVLDCEEREIAERIKYAYFYDKKKLATFENMIKGKNIQKIIIRLLYPNYYFDVYDEFINGKENNDKLKMVITKSQEYLCYVSELIKKTSFH